MIYNWLLKLNPLAIKELNLYLISLRNDIVSAIKGSLIVNVVWLSSGYEVLKPSQNYLAALIAYFSYYSWSSSDTILLSRKADTRMREAVVRYMFIYSYMFIGS